MSELLDFYLNNGTDVEGRKISEILIQNDAYFEFEHSYIQWLFPLTEPSNFNPDAPLLTDEDILLFRVNPDLRNNLRNSLVRFLEFLGIENDTYKKSMFEHANHNWFRITRVLKSLRLLGLENEAVAFYKLLNKIHEEDGLVSENSFSYWKEAVNGLVEM